MKQQEWKIYPLVLDRARPVQANLWSFPRRLGVTWDIHFAVEVGIVLKGRQVRQFVNHRKEIGPGDVWICGMWEPHGCGVTLVPCEVVVISALPQFLAASGFEEVPQVSWLAPFTSWTAHRVGTPDKVKSDVLDLGHRIRDLLLADRAYAALHVRLILYQILLLLHEAHGTRLPRSRAAGSTYELVGRTLERVLSTHEYVSLQRVAREMKVDRRILGQQFKSVMGTTLGEFSLSWRAYGAARQLAETDLPVKGIAADWGFTDSSHFNRVFVRRYRCTPIEYRRRSLEQERSDEVLLARL